ncbi:esterase-like activity of phytase family protein [Inquilinus sp. CAU 1745]|uniref:esterase-like activity of phytase family protein n=1 Tax=Inquilinus sp. CAU 1745 TaxID=3140369 RepID=UPI00325B2689
MSPWSRASLMASAALIILPGSAMAEGDHFRRLSTLPVFQNLPEGTDPAIQTVAEIVSATEDGMMLVYTDSPGEQIGFIDIADPAAPRPAGVLALEGEPTSVTVKGGHVFAAVNTSESFTDPSGHVAVIDPESRQIVARCDVGGQPDSIAASPDGAYLAVVIENERDEELNEGVIPQMPPGGLAILDLGADGLPADCDAPRMVDMTGLASVAGDDPEPEFVDINEDNLAIVTLQENNHLTLVDLATGEVTDHFPAGSASLEAIDIEDDGIVRGNGSLQDVPREPDAVAWLDETRFVTANEGDYEGGSRGFTIFDRTGEALYDSGALMEHIGMRHGHYPEGRADNKGVEPEGVEFGRFGDQGLFFVNSERGNFVAVFEDTGGEPEFVDFLPTAIGPEGVLAIPERNLFVVATEEDSAEDGFRATVSLYARDAAGPSFPAVVSEDDPATGAPIGWGALSALAADPEDPAIVWAASDSVYASSRIYRMDVSAVPARITDYVELTKDGERAAYDLEGIALRQGGGFWAVSEGAPEDGLPNLLLAVAEDGAVEQEIALPESVAAGARKHGFEGVASWIEDGTERVVVAFQREWDGDPEGQAKLGFYAPETDEWIFARYPLEAPSSANGGWVGLSEITHLGGRRFALIERDNQPGPHGAFKVVTAISLDGVTPAPAGGDLPLVEKTIVADLLPAMREGSGWISDKPEGLTVTADGRMLVVIDNDGVDDSTGETQLLRLGAVDELVN